MQSSNNFYAGIDQDIDPKYQKEGTYRYALNAVLETTEGDLFNISNEKGNVYDSAGFPTTKKIIGHTLTDNHEIVLFLYDPDVRPEHEIGIYDPLVGTYTTIAKSGLFNFKNPINALFRMKNSCNRLIYFTDNTNPYRVADITDTSAWVNPVDKTVTNINKITFSRPYNIPGVSNVQVKDGEGLIDYGSYLFYIRYLDENLNPTNRWIPLTNYIPVFYNSEALINTTLTHNADNTPSSAYYANKANKSIRLSLLNLDSSFKFYQLAVARKNSDTDIFTSVDILFPTEITSNSYNYKSNDDIFSSTSIDEILADNVKVETVKTHAIDNNRLYIANTSNNYYDYSLYQRLASKIRVQYRATPDNTRSSKNVNSYTLPKSLLKNEVIALGIVFVKEDGTETPVFHIPGRASNITQLSTHTNPFISEYTNWDTDTLTGDPNIVSGDKRWQIYNTASINPTSTASLTTGYLGYYQVSNTYPAITACDNNSYWGQDYWGNNLAGTPIRHHKIPPDWLFVSATHTSSNLHYNIELTLDNIELPEEFVGYYIMFSDDENTVIDRGYLSPLQRDLNTPEASTDQTYYHNYIEWDKVNWASPSPLGNKKYYSFTSPKTVYDSLGSAGNYIAVEKILKLGPTRTRTITTGNITVEEYGSDIGLTTFLNDYDLMVRPTARLNYGIVYNYYLQRSEIVPGANGADDSSSQINTRSEINVSNARIQNRSKNHNIVALELSTNISELTTPATPGPDLPAYLDGVTFVVSIKSTKDVYSNLYTIRYKKLHNALMMNSSTGIISGGNSFGIFFDTVEHYWTDGTAGDANSFHSFLTGKFDHRYNAEARSYSNIDKKYTYFKNVKLNDHLGFRKYIVSKYYQLEAEVPLFFAENYVLNKRFNSIVAPNEYYPLAFNYDFCNTCLDDNPYRIYYSAIDSTESTADLYRQIKPNNYKDIDGSFGPITDIFRSFNQLYLATTKTINLLPTKPQTLQTDIGNIYLGTGEVLSLPLTRLTSPDFSMGGLQNFKSKVSTEFGVFYIDEESSRPLLLTNNINDISKGLRNFWENNGNIKLVNQIKQLTSKDYLETNTIHGVGYISTYDPRFKRIIVHKKDYLIRPEYSTTFQYGTNITPNILWTDGYKFYYNNSAGEPTTVQLDNQSYFIPKSFTLSYSFISNSWVGYHSYFPYYMFNDHDTYYSSSNPTGVWKHNYGNYQLYYNTKAPHIIDLVALKNPIQAKALSSVIYTSKCSTFDENTSQFRNVDETFTSLIAYNSYQTSGKVDLIIKNQFDSSEYPLTYVSKVDNNFRINNVRDMSISHNLPIWTIEGTPAQGYPYLDKYPNLSNINFAKSYFEMQRFRDHYLGLRFEFNSQYNTKISTDLVVTTYDEKTR